LKLVDEGGRELACQALEELLWRILLAFDCPVQLPQLVVPLWRQFGQAMAG
jgi:hypothetical protein